MAWIGALITAAGGLIAANQQKQAAKGIGRQQDRLYGIQANTAERLQPFAFDFYRQASDAYAPALAYYKAITSGDRNRVLSAVSPGLRDIGSRYRSISEASRALNPRGGRSAAFNAELPYRAGDEAQSLINTERSSGFANLAKMAGLAGDLGSSAIGNSSNAAAGASGMLTQGSLLQGQLAGAQGAAYGDLGKALAGAWDAYKKRGQGGN